jgi:nucleotide-binding universal stress UspA family protein
MTIQIQARRTAASGKPAASGKSAQSPPDAPADRILAVLDGSEGTGRVLKFLIEWQRRRGTPEVVLLNIQPKPQDWRLHGYGWFQREAIEDRLINDLGRRVVNSAARRLDGAGIPHREIVELGDPVDVIRRCAQEHGCSLVMLAEPPRGRFRRWLARAGVSLGSVAAALVAMAPAPVLVVTR